MVTLQSGFAQADFLRTLKRVDELELQTKSLLSLLHGYVLAGTRNQFYCPRCEEGLMNYVEESRNSEGVIDWQAYQCNTCDWTFECL